MDALDPSRTVADLRELAELTSDDRGAQRVAWGPVWREARGWLRERLREAEQRAERADEGSEEARQAERDRRRYDAFLKLSESR